MDRNRIPIVLMTGVVIGSIAWLAQAHSRLDRAVWDAYVRPGPTRGIAAAGG